MSAPIVFFDIAGTNSDVLQKFYRDLFDWDIDERGNFITGVTSPNPPDASLMGAIRKDPGEKVIYIGVEDIDAKAAEIVAHGGSIDQPRFEVPGVVVLALFHDPAGNRLGLVEMDGSAVKVP
ncbi:MAG: VOC family protein [Pseudomonadota bacterium]